MLFISQFHKLGLLLWKAQGNRNACICVGIECWKNNENYVVTICWPAFCGLCLSVIIHFQWAMGSNCWASNHHHINQPWHQLKREMDGQLAPCGNIHQSHRLPSIIPHSHETELSAVFFYWKCAVTHNAWEVIPRWEIFISRVLEVSLAWWSSLYFFCC